jgi:hypothetical protein
MSRTCVSRLSTLACVSLVLSFIPACAKEVTRIADGRARVERAISPRAYAAYGQARLHERQGELGAARSGYLEVLRLDRAAEEAWIRLGALDCKTDLAAAQRAFDNAADLNPRSAALHRERARCLLQHDDAAAALSAAQTALKVAPQDPEASQLVIILYLASGNRQDALRYAWSHVAVFPNDTSGWLLLASVVNSPSGLGAQIQHLAVDRLPRQYAYVTASPSQLTSRGENRIDRAVSARLDLEHGLAANDTRMAQRAARELRLSARDLIEQAYALGALEFACDQAAIAGDVLPDDIALWQTRLRLLYVLRRDAEFDALLRRMPGLLPDTKPADFDRLLELVMLRTGVELASKREPK